MIIFDYIYYLILDVVFELRKRMPLYANDHARISSAYAFALLKLFQSRKISLARKSRLFELYSRRFSMPISVRRMAQTLYCDPRRVEILQYLSENEIDLSAERMRNRVLHALGRMPKYALQSSKTLKDKLTRPALPEFSTRYTQLVYHKGKSRVDRFSISEAQSPKKVTNKGAAILCLPLGRLVKADLEVFKGYDEIIVMPQMPCDNAVITAGLKSVLGPRVNVRFYDPKDHHAAPYSRGDAFISKACDDLGQQFMAAALASPSIRRFIPTILDEDLALDISDIIYRPIQRFYAALRSVETQGSNVPVYFSGPSNALPRTLALMGRNPVYILGQGSGVVSDEDSQDEWLLEPSVKEMTSGLNIFIKAIKKRLIAALPSIPSDGKNHIYIATNTRSKSYELAHNVISNKLTDIAPVTTFDFAAPKGIRNLSKASLTPCLYNALHSSDSGERALLSHFVQAGSRMTLDGQSIGAFPASEMKEVVSIALEQNIGALIGNVILYRLMVQKLDGVKNAQLLLLPGRHGNIRCLARAFETANLPSLDVQVLFVSEMSRYKPPMALRSAVIDSFARDRYVNEWDQNPENVHTIGAINLDEDIKMARSFDRKVTRKALLGSPQSRTLTFAAQPLPDTEIQAAVETIAKALKPHKKLHLCVKLHPSQSEALLGHISEYLMEEFGDKSRFTVLRNVRFAKVMSVTDILVSYFSNVCLMAPAFNVPVITLPSSAPMPSLTLSDMGLAVSADTLDDFEIQLKQVLSQVKSRDEHLPPHPYLKRNPHMTKPESLKRLAKLVKNSFY
ncbi:hypothetical protein N9W89_10530 [Hellea sp.]|nr:hypothetical protein [Hellea sp.]